MRSMWLVLSLLLGPFVSGCASSTPTAPPRPAARPFADVQHVAVVVTGDSHFTVVEDNAEPGRTFDEILKWMPWKALWLKPLAGLVHEGVNGFLTSERSATSARAVAGISPKEAVSMAFARALAESAQFREIRVLDHEPAGEDRTAVDAIVRLAVPSWGFVRVRDGDPALVSGFADVRAHLALRTNGTIMWETTEDVTDVERLPLQSFKDSPDFARQRMQEVLTRAGQRLATELVYSRGAGR
jgi:hypothetical protein